MIRFLVALLFVTISASGQDAANTEHSFDFGIQIGTNYTQPTFEIPPSPSSISSVHFNGSFQWGFQLGINMRLKLGDRFFLQSQLNFVRNRMKYNFSTTLGNGLTVDSPSIEEANSWLELPISVNYYIIPDDNFRLFIGGGLSFRQLLSHDISGSTTDSGRYSQNLFAKAQIGTELPISDSKKLLITLTYDRSLLSYVRKDTAASPDTYYDYRINSFSLTGTYVF